MPAAAKAKLQAGNVTKYADRFSAMGAEPRLRIMQPLLSAHPEGLTDPLEELLGFLYAECCTRNRAVKARDVIQIEK